MLRETMADIILFHHAQGLTAGLRAFAEDLRAAGHTVTLPDLYEGRTFDTLDAGAAHAEQIGMDAIIARGVAAVERLPEQLVYAGWSLGVLPAQKLAQTRPGAIAAILFHECVDAAYFSSEWPAGVALQAHISEHDPWCDHEAARQTIARAQGELHLYPGSAHLFTDSALAEYDADATAEVLARTITFLDRLG